jgi:hypothetical protein
MSFSGLIDQVEAVSGGTAHLDHRIGEAFDLPPHPYTRSLDAALQLIPAGWSVAQLTHHNDCQGHFTGWSAELYRPNHGIIPCPAGRLSASAALALCSAALRVRQSLHVPLQAA